MSKFSAAQQPQRFPFDRDFQVQLLGLLHQDFDFLAYTHELLHPDWFADDVLSWFFTTMRDHFIDYQMVMDETALKNELRKAAVSKQIKSGEINTYLKLIPDLAKPVVNRPYLSEEVSTFCRHQAIRKAAMETPDLLKQNDFDAIKSKWMDALQVGLVHDIGTEYFINYPDRIKKRHEDKVQKMMPIGITEMDIWLGGGLRPKQLGLWMAPTNRGKTLALIHCGKRAIVSGNSVLHYTLELSEDEIAERYDSAFSKIPMHMLADREVDLIKDLESCGSKWGNVLIVKEFPTKKATVATIMAHYRMVLQTGFQPDLVIVDYLNLIKPTHLRKNKREELTDTAEELRGAATETDVPWWSATQSRRGAISMETHGEEEVGEDIGMINTSDVTITLNQTEEELAQEIMRLFLAKNRNGPKYRTAKIATKFERMCFYDPLATSALATSSGSPDSSTKTDKSKKQPAKKKAGKAYSPITGGLIRT